MCRSLILFSCALVCVIGLQFFGKEAATHGLFILGSQSFYWFLLFAVGAVFCVCQLIAPMFYHQRKESKLRYEIQEDDPEQLALPAPRTNLAVRIDANPGIRASRFSNQRPVHSRSRAFRHRLYEEPGLGDVYYQEELSDSEIYVYGIQEEE